MKRNTPVIDGSDFKRLFSDLFQDLAEEPETDIVSPLHHSSPKMGFQHPHNRRLVSSPSPASGVIGGGGGSATMSRLQSGSSPAQRRLFSPAFSNGIQPAAGIVFTDV